MVSWTQTDAVSKPIEAALLTNSYGLPQKASLYCVGVSVVFWQRTYSPKYTHNIGQTLHRVALGAKNQNVEASFDDFSNIQIDSCLRDMVIARVEPVVSFISGKLVCLVRVKLSWSSCLLVRLGWRP